MDATSASSSPIEENYFMMSTGKKTPLKMFLKFRNFCPIRVEPPPYFYVPRRRYCQEIKKWVLTFLLQLTYLNV